MARKKCVENDIMSILKKYGVMKSSELLRRLHENGYKYVASEAAVKQLVKGGSVACEKDPDDRLRRVYSVAV